MRLPLAASVGRVFGHVVVVRAVFVVVVVVVWRIIKTLSMSMKED